MDKESRRFHAGEMPEQYAKAVALIEKSPVSKVIGNFFLGINKPPFPTKLFTKKHEAIHWLKKFENE